MVEDRNMTINVNGGQFSYAKDNATINAVQYNNGANANELDNIIKGIMGNLSGLKKEDADEIADTVDMVKEEFTKPEHKVSRLRNCLTLIAPMFTVANGMPTLVENLQKLVDYVMPYIR